MPPKKQPKSLRQPGAEGQAQATPGQQAAESDVDAAIAAAQSGRARQIKKPRAPVAPSKVKGDPDRPADAAVNAKKEMSYADAMVAHDAAFELARLQELERPSDEQRARMAQLDKIALKRSVLTEKGWVAVPNKKPRGAGAG